MALRPLTEEEKIEYGFISPEEALVTETEEPKEAEPFDPNPAKAFTRALPVLLESLYGSTQATIGEFQETRARIRDARGHDEIAKEFREKADLNEMQANDAAYRAKYGEEGAEQFKNLSDPNWWAATIGEVVPGSAPFLAGAATVGGATLYATGNPIAALIMAALGGGAVVFAQSYGDAYSEYLEKYPNDQAGADKYAALKSGISGIINGLSVIAGPFGMSKPMVEHFVTQAIIQGGIGGVDTVTQNLFVREVIDPTMDITTGLAKSIVGEAIGEGTIFTTAGRTILPTYNEITKEMNQEERDTNDEKIEAQTQERLTALVQAFSEKQGQPYPKNIEDLNRTALLEIIEDNELNVGTIVPNEGREAILNKLIETLRTEQQEGVIRDYMIDRLLSNFHPEKVYEEQKAKLDAMSDEELDAHILKEFGTPEAYARWASDQGEFSFDPNVPSNTREEERAAIANAGATLILRERNSGPIWKLGRNEFRDYIKDIEKNYTLEELRIAVKNYVPMQNEETVAKMTQSQLAHALAEIQAIIELQKQKRAKANKTKWVRNFDIDEREAKQAAIDDAIKIEGNALRVEVTITLPDGEITKVIGFERRGLDEEMSLAEKMALRGAELSVSRIDETPVTEENPFFNKTLEEVLDPEAVRNIDFDYASPTITGLELPIGTAPSFQGSAVARLYNWLLRPLMPIGQLMGQRAKQREGRLRSLEHTAQEIALETEQAIVYAIDKGDVKDKIEADRLIMAFLQKTGARLALTEEQTKLAKERIHELNMALQARDPNILKEDALDEIGRLEAQLEGIQKTSVALRQLPKSLRKPAAKIRKGIDVLSERLLNELPADIIDAELRETIEHNLNRYVTRSFAYFEPALGWNPTVQMVIEKFKNKDNQTVTKLYEKAVTSMIYQNKIRRPDYESDARRQLSNQNPTEEQIQARVDEIERTAAEEDVDTWLAKELFNASGDVAKLPGIFKGSKESEQQVGRVGKLLTDRGYIPYAIRALLGEIKSPELIAATSFSRIARVVETATFYDELRKLNDMPGEMWFSPVRTKKYNHKIETGDEFNPLDGYYTTGTMMDALSQGMPITGQKAVLDTLATVFGTSKAIVQYGIIVLSPGTQMRNLYGAAIMFTFNGHLKPEGFAETTRLIGNELFGNVKYDPETGEISGKVDELNSLWEYLQRLGVVNTEVRVNDMVGVFARVGNSDFKTINEITHALYTLGQTGPGKAFDKYVLSLNRGARRVYGASDDFFKILSFFAERKKLHDMLNEIKSPDGTVASNELKHRILREFAKTLKTKSGITERVSTYVQDQGTVLRNVTDLDKYIDHVSAYMVRNTMPNYDYIGKLREYYASLPIGNFIAFPTEIARTSANSAQLVWRMGTFSPSPELVKTAAIEENITLPNKPFLQRAQERAIGGYMATHGLVGSLASLSQIVFNVEDDDVYAANEIGPEYQFGDRYIWLGDKSRKGDETPYLNVDYFFPYEAHGRFLHVINTVLREQQGKGDDNALDEALAQFIIDYTESYTKKSIAFKTSQALFTNRNDRNPLNIKPIWNEKDDFEDKFRDGLKFAFDEAGPGIYSQVNDVLWSVETDDAAFNRYGKTMPFIRAAARLMGFSSSEINPNQSIKFLIGNRINEYEAWVRQNFSEVYISSAEQNEETVMKDWEDLQRAWFEVQQDLYFETQALKAWDVDEDVYDEWLDRFVTRTLAGSDFKKNMEKGVFTPWEVPDSYEKAYEDKKDELDLDRKWPKRELKRKYRFFKYNDVSLTANQELSRNLETNQLKED
jgi:hypothetical protein